MSLRRLGMARIALVLSLVGAVAVAAIVAAGCGGGGGGDSDNPSGNPIDRAFAAAMIPHHEGAIEMAQVARERAEHPEVRKLANDIIEAQKAEISVLRPISADLRAMGMESGHLGLDEHAMGMDADMSELEHEKRFDRTFMAMMIPHHQGAIRMARKELAGGKQAALRKIAKDIVAAQAREIAQMRGWSQRWYGEEKGATHMGGSM